LAGEESAENNNDWLEKNLRKSVKHIGTIWAVIPILILIWKWVPPVIPTLDVFLMNQTIRFLTGLLFLLWFFFPLFFSRKRRILIAIAFFCSVLLVSDSVQYAGAGKVHPLETDKTAVFTVYTQNILTNSIKRGKYDLLQTVESLQPDVVFLQEVSRFDCITLLEKFDSLGYEGFSCVDISPNEALGYAVFSRLPVRNAHAVIVPGVDWSPVWPVHAVEFLFRDEWISCLNVHLMPPHHGERGSFSLRPMQQRIAGQQIDKLLEYQGDSTSPALICGDFNQTPTSKILSGLRKKFTDSWRESGSGFGFSWNTRRPLFRIDCIWHNEKITAIKSELVRNNYSDHFGVYTVFKIKGE